ncbi:glutamate racemase [Aeromonas cavernicola]|uniref:Glutamate racemase n=1 Tax=Aeromonas cavernicola TaxID=1006623 RepID=A0A2H9U1W9_9GAMM|nr:glutamate racemase [Aeromonas cavernicola]PJG58013.1 glutamate racemase [Aeromonas cavernicola]
MANILVFDSGMGGLTIYREIRRVLPAHSYFYCFDNANFPYGELSEPALIAACCRLVTTMVARHHIDLVVIACNTASTIALPALRAVLAIPVVGVVPAIKPAAAQTRNGCIGLLATPGTVKRDYTHELIAQFAPGKRVLLKGTTELVVEAEHKLAGLPVNMALLREVLADWLEGDSQPDTLVLGCTHFPLLNDEIRQLMPQCQLIDSGSAVANRVACLLANKEEQREGEMPSDKAVAKAYCSRLDREADKLTAPLHAWGLSSLEEV